MSFRRKKQEVETQDGAKQESLSPNCPKCSCSRVEKLTQNGFTTRGVLADGDQVTATTDWDEGGWFRTVTLCCQNQKCLHRWTENLRITGIKKDPW